MDVNIFPIRYPWIKHKTSGNHIEDSEVIQVVWDKISQIIAVDPPIINNVAIYIKAFPIQDNNEKSNMCAIMTTNALLADEQKFLFVSATWI